MKVMELCDKTMIEVPDEWGKVVERLEKIIPYIKETANSGNSVTITLRPGQYNISINNYDDAKVGEHWIDYCKHVYEGNSRYNNVYVFDYVKKEEE